MESPERSGAVRARTEADKEWRGWRHGAGVGRRGADRLTSCRRNRRRAARYCCRRRLRQRTRTPR
ncbi:atherin-like [Iris pallida]|uniref:Atherin-like n=1 Tax=Iris pallida TaxID=29817 RepID=A0AAX6DQL4_IRIPA|nr:atherin-like [Iris pallida]